MIDFYCSIVGFFCSSGIDLGGPNPLPYCLLIAGAMILLTYLGYLGYWFYTYINDEKNELFREGNDDYGVVLFGVPFFFSGFLGTVCLYLIVLTWPLLILLLAGYVFARFVRYTIRINKGLKKVAKVAHGHTGGVVEGVDARIDIENGARLDKYKKR
jgi:hypothetical protein